MSKHNKEKKNQSSGHSSQYNAFLAEKDKQWSNCDNNAFYESLKVEGLREFAQKAGLVSGCDVTLLTPYWSSAKSILEVGAGYGRVIEYLLAHNCAGKITVVERCQALFEYLQQCYQGKVHLLNLDLHNFNQIECKFDLILFLWSGFSDFSFTEQPLVIKQLVSLLNEDGHLIVDTMYDPETLPLGMEQTGEQRVYKLELGGVEMYTYSVSAQDIDRYAQAIGLSEPQHLPYQTDSGRWRILHIIKKN